MGNTGMPEGKGPGPMNDDKPGCFESMLQGIRLTAIATLAAIMLLLALR